MSESGKPAGSGNRLRVLLADDHPLVLERVKALLQSTFEVVGVAHDGLEMVDEAMRLSPDIRDGNGDGVVDDKDINDFFQISNKWFKSSHYDFNLDGVTDIPDLITIYNNFGKSCGGR